jgi:hypothetical protein
MSSTFEKRERAQEAKFAHDQEMGFRVSARRDKLLGLWAAELMDMKGGDAQAYARQIVLTDVDQPGDDDVFQRVKSDLETAKVEVSDHDLRRKMDSLLRLAREQMETEA